MKPTVENYTVALPWYEGEHSEQLWQLAHDHDEMPRDYEVWNAAALNVINEWLARGRALQIVTIRPPMAVLVGPGNLPRRAEFHGYVESPEAAKARSEELWPLYRQQWSGERLETALVQQRAA